MCCAFIYRFSTYMRERERIYLFHEKTHTPGENSKSPGEKIALTCRILACLQTCLLDAASPLTERVITERATNNSVFAPRLSFFLFSLLPLDDGCALCVSSTHRHGAPCAGRQRWRLCLVTRWWCVCVCVGAAGSLTR